MKKINLTINGIKLTANMGETIFDVAQKNDIHIPNLCFDKSMESYGGCGVCLVEAEGSPKLLRACATKVSDGMVVNVNTERADKCRKIAFELLMSDHEGDCVAPCLLNCPAGTDCQGYLKMAAEGDYENSVRIIKETNPFPASIGRVCPHPCETACRRQLVEEPISIAFIKSFAADKLHEKGETYLPEKEKSTGKTVAVIGGGPGGLTAAYFLSLKGHLVTVFDSMPEMGGMLRYGIPEYRLPSKVLDTEIAEIASLGVVMKNNVKVGKDIALHDIREDYDAVVIAIGAWSSGKLSLQGEDLQNVYGGIDFLRDVSLSKAPYIGEKTAIVGGGNTAMDACRTAIRLGAKEVSVIYRRTLSEMPAEDIEITEAKEEGIVFRFLRNPSVILGDNGKITGVKLQVMELGKPDENGRRSPVPVADSFETIELDSLIIATGQNCDSTGFEDIKTNRWGSIVADERTFKTNLDGVFAIGDATNNGADIAIAAIGEAEKASKIIDGYLNGLDLSYYKPYMSERVDVTKDEFADLEKQPREKMNCLSPEKRIYDFNEINQGFTEKQGQTEAARCLECGCFYYEDCKLIHLARESGVESTEDIKGEKHPLYKERDLLCIERDHGKCILCGLCVRVCEEVVGKGILGFLDRAFPTCIKPEFRDSKIIEGCAQCLKCVDVCPTGAMKFLG
ncbi:MAG TPA: FAD-dependent oxidoreductase [Oscillospiraceae bacterium]|nr:FAD-dependent oxidoreductase [Oscillospiraceae bacterium]